MPNFSSRIIIRALISSRVMSSSSLKGLCRPGANQGGTDQVTELRLWCDVILRLFCIRQRVLRFPLAIS